MEKDELKTKAKEQIELHQHDLIELSLKIHANPELGFEEEKASSWLANYLEKNGFKVERGIAGLPTSFKGAYGSRKPVIAILAEYDALPKMGHACGHNIIAATAVGASMASKLAVDSYGGTVLTIGTPGEESLGGKAIMLEAGAFDGVDIAMMVHPGSRNTADTQTLACIGLDIEFFGKASHAAARPEQGINALEAMILSFNSINSLRQHINQKARIHGIITHGGEAANIVPAYCAAKFLIRAVDDTYLDELKEMVLNCFKAASLATRARLEHRWGGIAYAPMNTNLLLAKLFSKNLESLGRTMEQPDSRSGFGSTDMGNVSQAVPAIHPSIAIASGDVSIHSADFARAAASEKGHRGLLDAAKALAMTVIDLLSEPQTLARAKEEFDQRR